MSPFQKYQHQSAPTYTRPGWTSLGMEAHRIARNTQASVVNPGQGLRNILSCRRWQEEVVDRIGQGAWRNVGLLIVYIVFNVLIFTLGFYLYSGPGTWKKTLAGMWRKK